MSLTEEQMEYKIPIVKEGSKHFFSTNSAKDWDFQIYFESTHDNISKFKNVAKIQRDYDNDLHWITQLEEVPDTIKDYARVLINKNKPSKAILKANMAKHISKGRKMTEQIMNFSNPINGGTIDNINSSNVYFSNETNSNRNLKRKNEAEKDNANEELKQKQDVLNVEPAVPSVWLDFSHYIQSHAEVFHPYSLEANKIIRSGKGVSPKPYLDRVMYNKHMKSRDTKANAMPQSFHQYIDEYIDSVELTMAKKKIKPLSLLLAMNEEYDNDTANLEFLHQLLNQVHKSYASHVDYNSTEDAFNQLFIWPYLDVIAKSIKVDGCDSDFVQGQPILESMTQQLKAVNLYVNDKDQYKSDGLVKLFGLNNLELVLLETSGCFINKDKQKVKFDHHKGVYGALAMLKCIVDDYSYASIETFTKVKVFFLHAADTELHFWSVCYQKDGMFDLWRETSLKIKPDFGDKCDLVPGLIQFCWETKCLLEESIKTIVALKQEHISIKSKYRYNPVKPVLLSNTINPIILKLTKKEDCSGMAKLGPMYSPPHP